MKKISFEDALILNAIRLARFLVQILPYRAALGLGSFVGDAAYLTTKRRSVLVKNLRAVFAAEKTPRELASIGRESFRNIGRAGIELLRSPEMDRAFIERHVRVIGSSKVDRALEEKKGAIFLTAHFGSWEMLNISGGLLGYPMAALAREQKHPRSDGYLNDLRRSKGNEIIYKGMAVRGILRALKAGRIVGILSDQDGGKSGTFVDFFGRLSSYPKGVATFAIRTGAPVFPTFIFREGAENHRIEVEGPLLVDAPDASMEEQEKKIIQQFAWMLEAKIRKDPGQWLWAHRRWKSSPDRFVVILSDGKAGHKNQSLAFAEIMARERASQSFPESAFHLKVIEIRFKNEVSKKCFRVLYQAMGGRVPFPRFWAKKFLADESYREIMSTYADVVISTGSMVAGVNLWCAGENAARSVVIMDPGFGLDRFHAVIAPRHDSLEKKNNIYQTNAALASSGSIEAEARMLGDELGISGSARVVGFLAGGDAGAVCFDRDIFLNSLEEIRRAVFDADARILATTSRRTPAWADAAIKEKFRQNKNCPLLVIANEANRPGVVAGILGLSEIVVVSGESISMVSEAVSSGKKVFVIEPFKNSALKSKHRDFLDHMEKEGLIVRVAPEAIYERLVSACGAPAAVQGKSTPSNDDRVLREAARAVSR